jgi:hypothetical protein
VLKPSLYNRLPQYRLMQNTGHSTHMIVLNVGKYVVGWTGGTVQTTSPVNQMNAVNTMRPCQICGVVRQTSQVTFNRNIGMLVARQTKRINATMCKTCLTKNFWDFTSKNLLLGPWGMVSLIITPIYLVTNTVSYVSALQKLRGAVE